MKQAWLSKIKRDLRQVADKDKAKILARFFKTGRGEYGEGDKFLGVVVPEQRKIAKEALRSWTSNAPEVQLRKAVTPIRLLTPLLQSPFHEERLTALLVLVELYKKGDRKNKKKIFDFYIKNINHINNWDLVDLSAPNIVGDYLFTLSQVEEFDFPKNFLLKLARSKNLWSRRVAVLATFPSIKNKKLAEILALTQFLLFKQKERHDLVHKALGWMLREVGKCDKKVLTNFLDEYGARLPRITLRYAIEKFSQRERQRYLTLRPGSESR